LAANITSHDWIEKKFMMDMYYNWCCLWIDWNKFGNNQREEDAVLQPTDITFEGYRESDAFLSSEAKILQIYITDCTTIIH
jgi:hypothetical protein